MLHGLGSFESDAAGTTKRNRRREPRRADVERVRIALSQKREVAARLSGFREQVEEMGGVREWVFLASP